MVDGGLKLKELVEVLVKVGAGQQVEAQHVQAQGNTRLCGGQRGGGGGGATV